MNENVRRAMEIALQIKDKETTIEEIKGELDYLRQELEAMVGGTRSRRTSTKGTKQSTKHRHSHDLLIGIKKQIFDAANGKGRLRAAEVNELMGRKDNPGVIKVVSSELSRMAKEGLIKRIAMGLYEIGKAKGKPKAGRYSKTRVHAGAGERERGIIEAFKGKETLHYKTVAKRAGCSPGAASAALSTATKKGLAIGHGGGNYSLAAGAGKKASRAKVKRTQTRKPSRGVGVKRNILKAMGDAEISIQQIAKKTGLKSSSISAALSKLKTENVIGNIEVGIYRVTDRKARDEYLKTADTKGSDKPNGKHRPPGGILPKGYWSSELLKVMPVGKPMKPITIIKAMGCSKDKYPSAYMSIYAMGKDGVLTKNGEGFYINEGGLDKKVAKREEKSATIPLPGRSEIKNFPVKKLSDTQELFLKHQKENSLSARIMKLMKHGKEYSIDSLSDTIDPNLGKSSYRSCLAKLTIVGFVDRVSPGIFVRV